MHWNAVRKKLHRFTEETTLIPSWTLWGVEGVDLRPAGEGGGSKLGYARTAGRHPLLS